MPPRLQHSRETPPASSAAFGDPTVVAARGKPKRWEPPAPQELGDMLAHYEVDMLLGRGGMGAVYKGKHKTLDRVVAIKILPPEVDDLDASYAARFKNEAKAMARLSHPNIVQMYTYHLRPVSEPASATATALGSSPNGAANGTNAALVVYPRDDQYGSSSTLSRSSSFGAGLTAAEISHGWEVRLVFEFCDRGTLRDEVLRRTR